MSGASLNTDRGGGFREAVSLNVEGLTVRAGPTRICRDFNLEIRTGEHWGILGGNGVGKTTLLHTLAGLRKPVAGRVMVDAIDLRDYQRRHLARKVGVLFQDSQDTFPATVKETVLTGRFPYQSFWPGGQREDIVLADTALAQLNLAQMQDRQVDTLSGGERRRLAIATLFLQDPGLWLLDEPTNHLDFHHQVQVLDLVGQRVRERNGALADGAARRQPDQPLLQPRNPDAGQQLRRRGHQQDWKTCTGTRSMKYRAKEENTTSLREILIRRLRSLFIHNVINRKTPPVPAGGNPIHEISSTGRKFYFPA